MEENKYIFDLEEIMKDENQEKQNIRKKKHKTGRAVAWLVLVAIVLLIGTGGYFGIKYASRVLFANKDKNVEEEVNVEEERPNPLEELLTPAEHEELPGESLVVNESEVIIDKTPTVVEPSYEELFEEAIRAYIAQMSTEDKAAGLFIVAPEQITSVATVTKAGEATKKALEKYAVGGIIYSTKNVTSKDQFKEVIENTKSYARRPLFVAVDEELGYSIFPSSLKLTATKKPAEIAGDASSQDLVKEETGKLAANLKEFGINLNMGVTADVLTDAENTVVGDRSFGVDPSKCAELVALEIETLTDNGIGACVKTFPGQGSSSQSTSEGLAVSTRTKEEMDASEFVSFKCAIESGAKMVVVGHISAPNLIGDNTQCSQSKDVMTELIRKEFGYDDVIIITDSLSKAAISSYVDSQDACITAIKAGADMVMCPEKFLESLDGVLDAINTNVISMARVEDSLTRIYKVKFEGMTPEEIYSLIVPME